MLAFDLPDYSKSSTAQNEKLAGKRERERETETGGGDSISIPSPPAKPNSSPPSPRASRRFGVAVMSKSESDTIGTVGNMAAERKRERGRKKEILFNNDVCLFHPHFRSIQPYMCVERDQMFL